MEVDSWGKRTINAGMVDFPLYVEGNTLWLFNIAMENDPFSSMVYLLKMVIFHGYVK